MQPVTDASRAPGPRRGRPRGFDVDAATVAALGLLWKRGYDATSIDDLVAATGLNPSSLYGAFGSKRGVFEAALERYDREMDAVLAPLAAGPDGLDAVLAFLDQVRAAVADPGSPGCFMVNTTIELAPRDPDIAVRTRAYQDRIHRSLRAALARAGERGEIDPATVDDRARLAQASLYGVFVAARGGATEEAIAAVDALDREVRRWRLPGDDAVTGRSGS